MSTTSPSWASSTGGTPEAGSAWATLPPIVPRLRTAGCAIRPAHSTSAGSAAASSASSFSAAMRRNAPIRTTSASTATWSSSVTPGDVDEDLGAGRARTELGDQRLATGEHPGPPPASAATVSSTVVVRW